MNHQQESERDELRARFTGWLEVTLYRAKLNYLKRQERERNTLYVGMLPEELLVEENLEQKWVHRLTEQKGFDFEQEKLEKAFQYLTQQRQQILTLLFVEEKTPEEIARQLGCSKQNVYKQRSQALAALRNMLEKGGEGNE